MRMRALGLALLCLSLRCEAALTTVQDTLYTATGGYCSGTVTISWQTFMAPDGHTVYGGSVNSAIAPAVNGLTVTLEPGQYTASYNITPSGCVPAYEQWIVPASSSPVNLGAVRSIVPPTPFAMISLGWLAQGGATLGQNICWLGMRWGPGNCGGGGGGGVWGSITGTLSAQTDLAAALAAKQAAIAGAPATWPSFATVATTGNYGDLTGKPTIPAAQVNSDWNASSGLAQILNKPTTWAWSQLSGAPTFATVATSGSYGDLINKPTLASLGGFANPMTAAGDFIVGGTGGVPQRLTTPGNGTFCPSWSSGLVTWITCPGAGGGISSIGLTMPSWLSVSNSPLLANGTIAVSAATGQTSHQVIGTCGSATSFGACALVAGDIPALSYQAPITTGTVDQVLNGALGLTSLASCSAAGGMFWYNTTTHVSSCHTMASTDLPLAAMGTITGGIWNATPLTASYVPAIASLTNYPLTTAGDLFVGGTSGAPARLAAGALDTSLMGGGAGVAPSYLALVDCASTGGVLWYSKTTHAYSCHTLVGVDIPTLNQSTTGNAATATALAAAPTLCTTGYAPTGILANGNATGCASISGGSMTWPAAPGIMVYGGSSAYGASLTAPAGTIVGTTDSQTLSNKTAVSSGAGGSNAITGSFEIHLPVALCTAASTSALAWDIPPSAATAATAAGCSGSNVNDAAGAFANTGTPSVQYSLTLPQTLTGTADVYVTYSTATASGTFTPALDAVCTATNSTATNDPSWTANNFFHPGSQTASSTANRVGTASTTAISWPSGCTGGNRLHLRLIRTDTSGAASVLVYEVTIVARRTL